MAEEISRRQARKRLARKEQLQEGKARTYNAALRVYNATKSVGTPGLGDGQPAFGEIIQHLETRPDGQKNFVRWHNGTITVTWFRPGSPSVGTWVIATTRWHDMNEGPWLIEREMYVEELFSVITAEIKAQYEDYWRYSKELDDLELNDFLMIAEAAPHFEIPTSIERREASDQEKSRES